MRTTIKQIDQQMQELRTQLLELATARNQLIKRKLYTCACGHKHRIGEVVAIRSEWYESPHGCMDGDLWHDGEAYIMCPKDDTIATRVLFERTYSRDERNERKAYFDLIICPLFSSYTRKPDRDIRVCWANTYEFQQDAERFGYISK